MLITLPFVYLAPKSFVFTSVEKKEKKAIEKFI